MTIADAGVGGFVVEPPNLLGGFLGKNLLEGYGVTFRKKLENRSEKESVTLLGVTFRKKLENRSEKETVTLLGVTVWKKLKNRSEKQSVTLLGVPFRKKFENWSEKNLIPSRFPVDYKQVQRVRTEPETANR